MGCEVDDGKCQDERQVEEPQPEQQSDKTYLCSVAQRKNGVKKSIP